MEQIGKVFYISVHDELLQSRLGKPLDIHSVPAYKKSKRLDMFRLTLRIGAVKRLCLIFHGDLCGAAADRTFFRDVFHTASRQVLRDLRNDHVRLVHGDPVSHSQFQFFHDTDIVDAGTAYRRSFQFHRLKYGNRIDQSCPRRTPFDLCQRSLADLVRPLKRKGIPGELCRRPQ